MSLRLAVVSLFLCSAIRVFGQDDVPAGFHWVDFKREASIVSKIEHALKDEDYTAIREIGLTGSFALVMTVQREPGLDTFYGDAWRVYSVSTRTWKFQTLIYGFDLRVQDWIRFQSPGPQDVGLLYKDCWECEPATMFTALHYDPQKGWSARWVNPKDLNHPGIAVELTDVGDPYTNEDVDQVFAVLAPKGRVATVGTWYSAKDLSTGKINEAATKYWVDQSTGSDKSADLKGPDAKTWEAKICKRQDSPYGLSKGQSSSACKKILGGTKEKIQK